MSDGMIDLITPYQLCPECGWEYHNSNSRCPDCHPSQKPADPYWICPKCEVEILREDKDSHVCGTDHDERCKHDHLKSRCELCEGETEDTAADRKATPIYSGVLMYFPDALAEIARCSKAGNDQHNPNSELHWDRSKSGDELDALTRHLMDAGKLDSDGVRHSTKVAWRALANLQKEIEQGIDHD